MNVGPGLLEQLGRGIEAFGELLRGKRHPHAIRILMRSWLRVMWACWQSDIAYDPDLHGGERRMAA